MFIYNLYSAVSWNDTTCSYKAVLLTGPIVRFLATEDLLTSSIANNVLIAVFQGLQVHGQHETNQVIKKKKKKKIKIHLTKLYTKIQ